MEENIKIIENESNDLICQAQEMTIINAEDYIKSAGFFKSIKKMKTKIDETFDPMIKKAHSAHKEAIDLKNKFLLPVSTAEKSVQTKLQAYQQAERRKAEAEQARLAELQRRETERLQNQARIAEEKAEALQERARILQETNSIEAERLRLQAEKIAIKAETLTEKAQQTEAITPVVEINIPKVSGITNRDNFGYRIKDMKAFLAYCLANYPTELVTENSVAMGKLARATRGTLVIPGVEFYNDNRIGGCR